MLELQKNESQSTIEGDYGPAGSTSVSVLRNYPQAVRQDVSKSESTTTQKYDVRKVLFDVGSDQTGYQNDQDRSKLENYQSKEEIIMVHKQPMNKIVTLMPSSVTSTDTLVSADYLKSVERERLLSRNGLPPVEVNLNPQANNCRSQPQLKENSEHEQPRFKSHDFANDVTKMANASLAESFGIKHTSIGQIQNHINYNKHQVSTTSGAPTELKGAIDHERIMKVLENNSRVVGSVKTSLANSMGHSGHFENTHNFGHGATHVVGGVDSGPRPSATTIN